MDDYVGYVALPTELLSHCTINQKKNAKNVCFGFRYLILARLVPGISGALSSSLNKCLGGVLENLRAFLFEDNTDILNSRTPTS